MLGQDLVDGGNRISDKIEAVLMGRLEALERAPVVRRVGHAPTIKQAHF